MVIETVAVGTSSSIQNCSVAVHGPVGVGGGGASVLDPRLARRPSQPRLVEVALSVLVGLPVPNEVVFDARVRINRGSGGGAQPAA